MYHQRGQRGESKSNHKERTVKNIIKIAVGLSIFSSVALAENHALIIGCCDKYEHLKNIKKLYGAENDAQHMFDLLVNEHKAVLAKNTVFLKGENATYSKITKSLKGIEESDSLNEGDTLYLFYSGHGTSLFDRGYFGKKFKTDKMVREWISNSTGLIPYDFNPKRMLNSMIITKRDFKPVFKRLDSRGVKIVWIVDACFAGNAYRSGDRSDTQKFMKFDESEIVYSESKKNRDPNYQQLLFYGASLATLSTTEHPYQGESRGDFSVEVEKCLNKSYNSSNIKHRDFKKCLNANFSNTQIQHNYYPQENRQDSQVVIKASKNPTLNRQSQSYKERLFALQNTQPLLNMSISSLRSKSQVIKTFCNKERVSLKLDGERGKYIIAFTQDSGGKVIMIQPDKKNKMRGNELFDMEVQKPFGTDRVKVFATNDQSIYNRALKFYDKPQGVLSNTEIEKIYKALKSSGDFKTANMSVETISTDIEICKKGD